ncbi:MAG: ABC transporter ATP-binding protein [Tidjanibacter sp.]|nr:ABC transporter ATP-binding protein [Tidjanibacter sp.]MBQ1964726.1 ABC transporter ATP-binding protein [Tidjanibacter sp.]MBQ5807018.1 ABC transporter ATP-binding protein [Tidjanibacter sp.]
MIEISNLHKHYDTLEVLRGVSLTIAEGEVVAIVGPSGAGKTTLMHVVGALSDFDSGSVVVDGVDLRNLTTDTAADFRNRRIGFVFQMHYLLPEFTALENVCLPAMIAGVGRKEAEAKALELLSLVGLSERTTHKPAQLSGGEQQRVAIARALINEPRLLLADEPSGNLDSYNRGEIHRLFFELRDKLGITVVVVTHDEGLADMSDRKITITDGQIE